MFGKNNKFKNLFLACLLTATLLTSIFLSNFSGSSGLMTDEATNTSVISTKALALSTYWTYGGSNYDDGWAITKDALGNLYLAGTTKETGDYDVIF